MQAIGFALWKGIPPPGTWQQAVADCEAVVALAGEPVMGIDGVPSSKKRLYDSRVEGVRRVVKRWPPLPWSAGKRPASWCRHLLLATTARGGSRTPRRALRRAVISWPIFVWTGKPRPEAGKAHGLRVVCLRIGVVLGEGGGALEK